MKSIALSDIKITKDQSTYLLIDHADSQLQSIYQHWPNPDYDFLFMSTALEQAKSVGPLLLLLEDTAYLSWISQRISKDPNTNIMLIETKTERAMLLSELRRNLFVSFPGNKIGVLRYYDTTVASYLFSCPIESSQFKHIDCIYWHGNTFKNQICENKQWYKQEIGHGDLASENNTDEIYLSELQSNVLTTLLKEQFIADLTQEHANKHSFSTIEKHFDAVTMQSGITKKSKIKKMINTILEGDTSSLSTDNSNITPFIVEEVNSEVTHRGHTNV